MQRLHYFRCVSCWRGWTLTEDFMVSGRLASKLPPLLYLLEHRGGHYLIYCQWWWRWWGCQFCSHAGVCVSGPATQAGSGRWRRTLGHSDFQRNQDMKPTTTMTAGVTKNFQLSQQRPSGRQITEERKQEGEIRVCLSVLLIVSLSLLTTKWFLVARCLHEAGGRRRRRWRRREVSLDKEQKFLVRTNTNDITTTSSQSSQSETATSSCFI